jgi:uncharacterized membrane protein (UPF0127 family)
VTDSRVNGIPVHAWGPICWSLLILAGLSLLAVMSCNGKEPTRKPVQPGQEEGRVTLTMGGKEVTLEVASTNDKRLLGLMRRTALQPDHGMIFIYPEPHPLRFWMKDTWIPLSIAFVKEDGTIINIDEMRPGVTETPYMVEGKCRFAIEMTTDWFKAHGIQAGDRIALTPEILAIESEPRE